MRLQIRPGLYQLWRAPGRLQIGLDPSLGVVLDGLTPDDELTLSLLDGTLGQDGLLRRARRLGLQTAKVRELLATLRESGVLLPTRTHRGRLARLGDDARARLRPDVETLSVAYPDGDGWDVVVDRAARSVAVVGLGRTGLAVAGQLARAGVGTVVVDDDQRVLPSDCSPGGYDTDDVGRWRAAAAADVITSSCPDVRTSVRGNLRPDLLVLVGHGAIDPRRTEAMLREDVPHLAVVLRERDAVVGPLVRPGVSACLRCLDLHRRDRDPEWPRLVPQLSLRGSGRTERVDREETVLAGLAASLATAQALAHLDGRSEPPSLDATLETSLPDGLVAVRPWTTHPECGCTWPPRSQQARPLGARRAAAARMGA